MTRRRTPVLRRLAVTGVACLVATSIPSAVGPGAAAEARAADGRATDKNPVAVGTGGAVSSVDPE
ncbi:MAG: hypothetical protein ACRDOJ_08260, partial [Nocardioidaceae bacterium]